MGSAAPHEQDKRLWMIRRNLGSAAGHDNKETDQKDDMGSAVAH